MPSLTSLTSLALAAGLAVAAPAATYAAAAKAAPKAVATWTVDKAASKLGFKSAFNGKSFEGGFRRWDAAIAFDPKNLAVSKVIVSVDTGSAKSGDNTVDESLPTDDWFGAAKFPRATFTAASFKDLGAGRYQAAGSLAMKGVTRPVNFNFTLAIQGDVARVTGTANIMRNAFGVGLGQFAAADTVPYEVSVPVTLVARRNR